MSARDAAVRAVAEALKARFPDGLRWAEIRSTLAAEEVLAALATSADVRAGLIQVFDPHLGDEPGGGPCLLRSGHDGDCMAAFPRAVWADAVLAALGGGGA